MKLAQRLLFFAAVTGWLAAALPNDAGAYDFWRQYNGRQDWETAGYYDLNDEAWAVLPVTTLATAFSFDWSVAFPTDGFGAFIGPFANAGVRATWETQSSLAISDWAAFANIALGTKQAAGSGHIQFSFQNGNGTVINPSVGDPITSAPIVYDVTKAEYWDRPYIDINTGNPDPAAMPVAAQIRYSALHEFGHALGLDDLHGGATYSEDFVDHPLAGNVFPDRTNASRNDNIMIGCQPATGGACDYRHAPVIDNDEVAGVTWLWGGPYNQIVTGDLAASWNHASLGGRNTEEHHGDQDNPAGWWDYRGSIVPNNVKPYIDIQFAGYETFLANTYPAAPVIYGGNQGGDIERFIVDQAGWWGNFELFLKSSHTDERFIPAWIVGNRTDKFILTPTTGGLDFKNGNEWAKVFGPVPEPSSVALGLMALAACCCTCRLRGDE